MSDRAGDAGETGGLRRDQRPDRRHSRTAAGLADRAMT